MRKTIATVVTLALVWIGYTAWPLYDLWVLVHAMENRDVGTVTRHVYFDAVRVSLTKQVVAAYVRRTRINISPFAQSMAAGAFGIANPIVQKLISPEALSELLGTGWPVTVGSDPPPGTVGITERTIGTIWQIFKNSEYGAGVWSLSPFQRIFRTCSGMSWPRPCERQYQTSDGRRQCKNAARDGLDNHFLSSASRCLTSLSSSSVCCAMRSAFRASSSAPENAAACSTSWRMLSRMIAMRFSSCESELPLLMMFSELNA
jgi:Protein of unknown function (DUF2939)